MSSSSHLPMQAFLLLSVYFGIGMAIKRRLWVKMFEIYLMKHTEKVEVYQSLGSFFEDLWWSLFIFHVCGWLFVSSYHLLCEFNTPANRGEEGRSPATDHYRMAVKRGWLGVSRLLARVGVSLPKPRGRAHASTPHPTPPHPDYFSSFRQTDSRARSFTKLLRF